MALSLVARGRVGRGRAKTRFVVVVNVWIGGSTSNRQTGTHRISQYVCMYEYAFLIRILNITGVLILTLSVAVTFGIIRIKVKYLYLQTAINCSSNSIKSIMGMVPAIELQQ